MEYLVPSIIGAGLLLMAFAVYRLFNVPAYPVTVKEKNNQLFYLDKSPVLSGCCSSIVKVHKDSIQRYFYCEQCHRKTYDTGEPTFSGGYHEI